MRQGCVLSPRLFSCVLEVALKKWREQLQNGGLDFGDGGIPLLDLRFADDILLFATPSVEAARMVDALVTCLKEVGLALKASKTKILTTQAQPGKTVTTQNGLEMEILDATKAHKWLGCLLSTLNTGNREADLDFRLQATSRAFYANKRILCECRKLLRQVVGPPGSIDWTQPWHSILHLWNQRVVEQMQLNGFELWSNRCMVDYWKCVQYVAVLDDSRWLKRALKWNAGGGRRGRSFDLWDAPVTKFCRWQNIREWQVAAQDKALWLQYLPDFVTFCQTLRPRIAEQPQRRERPKNSSGPKVYKLATAVVGGADLDEASFSDLKQWKILAQSFCFAQHQWSACVPCPCVTDARLRNETNIFAILAQAILAQAIAKFRKNPAKRHAFPMIEKFTCSKPHSNCTKLFTLQSNIICKFPIFGYIFC